MARIRSAKPEWWSSAKWCALPRDVRFTYKGIWEVMADDAGRFEADPRQIKAQVWPLDDDITPKKIAGWLPRLAAVQVRLKDSETRVQAVVLYESGGVQYGFLPGFVKHQKISNPTPSKLPKPPELFANDSGNFLGNPQKVSPEREVDVEEEKESDGEGEEDGALALFGDVAKALAGDPNDPHLFTQFTGQLPRGAASAYLAECKRALDGVTPPHLTPEQLRQACRDFLTNRAPQNIGLFRGYLRTAAAKSPEETATPADFRAGLRRIAKGGAA